MKCDISITVPTKTTEIFCTVAKMISHSRLILIDITRTRRRTASGNISVESGSRPRLRIRRLYHGSAATIKLQ